MEKVDKKNKKKLIKILLGIFIVIFLSICLVAGYAYNKLSKLQNKSFTMTKEEAGDSYVPQSKDHKVRNILLMGIDTEENASDTMIVLSFDEETKQIKMTSIMRDMYVYFGEGKRNKINQAYMYGGPKLTIKTINENLNLDIEDYIKVDFKGLDKIIDALGGVQINIEPEELDMLNSLAQGMAATNGDQLKLLKKSGLQTLTGNQAVAYCRIRKVGNNDYERTQRQRRVLESLFSKFKTMSPTKYPDMIDKFSGSIETSIGTFDLLSLMQKGVSYGKNGIVENRVPYDGYKWDSEILDHWYVMKWDKAKNTELLHEFIYLK